MRGTNGGRGKERGLNGGKRRRCWERNAARDLREKRSGWSGAEWEDCECEWCICTSSGMWFIFHFVVWQATPEELINMTKKTHHTHAVHHWVCVCEQCECVCVRECECWCLCCLINTIWLSICLMRLSDAVSVYQAILLIISGAAQCCCGCVSFSVLCWVGDWR